MTSDQKTTTDDSMPFPAGTVLAGKYRVDRLLGEGGMGWVVVATHLQLEQRVALKFMRTTPASTSSESVGRFLREARAAARIQSEHVARVSDVGTLENGAPYLVMEYLEGQDLDSLLQKARSLPIDEAVEYAMQACEGLGEVHAAGIVHRDLKPANLFLARRSDGSARVKLLDFGISKVTDGSGAGGMTSTQALMGSPLYMAPEQMRSSKNVDVRADIWSMGVIMYEMLGGRTPFGGDTLPEVCARIMAEPPMLLREARPDVPPALEAVVMRCLEKDPGRRFPDVAALAQALAPFGRYDARTAADRIGRVVRKVQPSSEDLVGSSRTTGVNRGRPVDGAQTAAAFGTVSTTHDRRGKALPWAIAGGAVVLLGVVAVVAISGSHASEPTAQGAVSASAGSTVPGTAGAARASLPLSSAAATEPTEAPLPAFQASGSASAPAVASATKAAVAGHALAKPKPAVSPAVSAKPASTSSFGGRD